MYNNELKKELLKYFKENNNSFIEAIEELDYYNGCLSDDRYYPMDEIGDILFNREVVDLLQMAYFGEDEETCSSGFNPNREYFTFNAYGNLVSSNYKDYSSLLD